MAENSAIEWCHHTFNPWIGCTKVGPGCEHCYAEILAASRLGVSWGPGAPRRRTQPSTWLLPRRWDRAAAAAGIHQRVFCASLADVFDNEVPVEWRADLFALLRATPNLDWLLVTKRIGNAAKMAEAAGGWPANVWLGATIVNQDEADRDIPKLLSIDGPRFRFLSMEPLLGPVSLRWLAAWPENQSTPAQQPERQSTNDLDGLRRLDWIIVGGESGTGARPMHPDWVRALRDQCAAASVPFLFKQWGEWSPGYGPKPKRYAAHWSDGSSIPRWSFFDDQPRSFWIFGADALLSEIGKKAAGRRLDGVQHDGYPTSSGGEPDAAPLTDSDALAASPASVSAPKAAQSEHALAAAKPETPAP